MVVKIEFGYLRGKTEVQPFDAAYFAHKCIFNPTEVFNEIGAQCVLI